MAIAATDALVEKLTIHFSHRKTRAISVKGTTMNVPLPITLTASRAQTIWYPLCLDLEKVWTSRLNIACILLYVIGNAASVIVFPLLSARYHELGTHFLRNAINEPERARQGLSRRRVGQGHVPFGARGGLKTHLSRLAKVCTHHSHLDCSYALHARVFA